MTEGDDELRGYLDGRSRLSARYRAASRETTTPELDAAVLDYARTQTAQPAPRRRSRWFVPLATAATLVLGVDLVWHLRHWAAPPREPQGAHPTGVAAPAPPAAAERAPAAAAPTADVVAPSAPPPAAQKSASPAPAEAAPTAEALRPQTEAAMPPAAESRAEADAAAEAADAEVARKREAAERRSFAQLAADRSASDEQAASAPSAAGAEAELAEAAEPPALAVAADAVAEQAEALAQLLRDDAFDALKQRYAVPTFPRPALQAAAEVLRTRVAEDARRLREQDDRSWRIDYLDADGQVRCTARLRRIEDGWQLLELITRP